ncbi:MAG: polyamine ABC transporter substrate-binding protein [Gammaproteobacteria bacterium]|nr:polyamine ABC transporter substrate-binding protein [Gammaproteobacteria bacterium]MBV8402725.1 polyamine ABC transporter substrate-binding protein [Gammaproteobacteria bacterium]
MIAAVSGCGGRSSAQQAAGASTEKVLNVYNWSDYIQPAVIGDFEKEYGIRVNYDVYDSNEILETKLLTGHTNYDIVGPSGAFLERQIKADIYQKLDKALLPNLANVDPQVASATALYDPGNQYAIDYMWITSGVGYNRAAIHARLADAPVDSWRMLLDPAIVARFSDCGISVLDAPSEVVGTVLLYLGRNPNSNSTEDLHAAEVVLHAMRPYVRYVDSSRYIDMLANGDLCLVMGWSGDVKQAHDRALEAGKGIDLAYAIPREGAIANYDVMAIPADAPHVGNAHLFLNYLLRPEIAARNSNLIKYANAVRPDLQPLDPAVRNDPGVYPPPEVRARLVPERARPAEFQRVLTRMWTRFKTGK